MKNFQTLYDYYYYFKIRNTLQKQGHSVGIGFEIQYIPCCAQSLDVAAPGETLLPNIVRHLGD